MNNNSTIIIYGMSGSLKMTTINSPMYNNYFKVYSDTKPFYNIDEKYLNWSSCPNDGHLMIHRLLTLDLEGYLPNDRDIIIERGVTDNIFCIPNRKLKGLESYSNIKVDDLVKLESDIILKRTDNSEILKLLLIMEDDEFIENEVLNEKKDGRHRKSIYPNLSIYKEKQNEYIDFTTNYNSIDKTIVITDAWDYINKLNNYGK